MPSPPQTVEREEQRRSQVVRVPRKQATESRYAPLQLSPRFPFAGQGESEGGRREERAWPAREWSGGRGMCGVVNNCGLGGETPPKPAGEDACATALAWSRGGTTLSRSRGRGTFFQSPSAFARKLPPSLGSYGVMNRRGRERAREAEATNGLGRNDSISSVMLAGSLCAITFLPTEWSRLRRPAPRGVGRIARPILEPRVAPRGRVSRARVEIQIAGG